MSIVIMTLDMNVSANTALQLVGITCNYIMIAIHIICVIVHTCDQSVADIMMVMIMTHNNSLSTLHMEQ